MESGIVLCVPELAPAIDRWRIPTVRSAAFSAPVHVTCLYPWHPAPVTPQAIAELQRSVRGFGVVTLTFRRLATFPSGVLYLLPEPPETVVRLTRRLEAAFPKYPPYGGQFPDPQPHLTIAEAAPGPQLDALRAEVDQTLATILPVTIVIDHITVMEQDTDRRWHQAHQIPLI